MSDQQPPGQPSGEPPYQPPAGGWYDPVPGGQAGSPTPYPPPAYQQGPYQPGPQQAPYPQAPYQQAPYQQGPYQQPPAGWTQPPAGAGRPPRKSSTVLVLAIAGGAIALVLIVIVTGVVIGRRDKPIVDPVPSTNPSGGLPSPDPSTAPPPATAADAVRAYFAALTSNDANAALALGVARPEEKTLLTSAVLAESNRIAPISDVTVTDTSDPSSGVVAVSYRIGATPVRESIPVVKVGEEWRLGRTYTWLDLANATAYGRNPVVVNKVRLSRTTAGVFPGTYAFASASKYTSFGSRTSVTVAGLTRTPSTTALRLQLTKTGVDQVRNAARKSVTSCMKQRKLHPSGCPLGVNPGGYRVDAKTLRWKRQGGDPIGKAKVTFDAATLEASTSFRFRVNGTIRCRSGAGSGTCTVRIDHKRTALIQLTRPDRVYWS